MSELKPLLEDLSTTNLAKLEQTFKSISATCKAQKNERTTNTLTEYAADIDQVIALLTVAALTDQVAKHNRHSTSILYHIFDIITHVFRNSSFTASALLELVNGDSTPACFVLASALRFQEGSLETHLLASQLCVQLTAASSLYNEGECVEGVDIAELTHKYNLYVTKLLDAVISADVIDSFGRCVCFHQRDHATTDLLIADFCKLVTNLLSFSSDKQRVFRTHLAHSGLISDIFFPYIENVLPVLVSELLDANSIEWKTLTGVLRVLAVVSFKIRLFRKKILTSTVFIEIFQIPGIENHSNLVLALLQLAINADFAAAPFWPEFFDCLFAFVNEKLGASEKARIATKLGRRLPGVPLLGSAECRRPIFELLGVVEQDQAPSPMAVQSIPPEIAAVQANTPEIDQTRCGLTGAKISCGMRSPCGHVFEKKAILEWLVTNPMCPADGQPLVAVALIPLGPESNGTAQGAEADAKKNESMTKLGLEGLPPLATGQSESTTKAKVKVNRNLEALNAAPAEFKCALDGKLLINPLRSPYGHVFEKRTLERWVEAVGSVCPVTEKTLRIEDCLPDVDLKKIITRWLKEHGVIGN